MLLGDNVNVTDAGMLNLKGLTRLQHLSLAAPQVTDAGIANLQGLIQLQSLDLSDTKVTDAGLRNLQGLKQLRRLSLNRTNVTEAGLVNQKGLIQLEIVAVVGLRGLRRRAGLPQRLGKTQVRDAGWDQSHRLSGRKSS